MLSGGATPTARAGRRAPTSPPFPLPPLRARACARRARAMSLSWSGYGLEALTFNADNGYLEAILRGYKVRARARARKARSGGAGARSRGCCRAGAERGARGAGGIACPCTLGGSRSLLRPRSHGCDGLCPGTRPLPRPCQRHFSEASASAPAPAAPAVPGAGAPRSHSTRSCDGPAAARSHSLARIV